MMTQGEELRGGHPTTTAAATKKMEMQRQEPVGIKMGGKVRGRGLSAAVLAGRWRPTEKGPLSGSHLIELNPFSVVFTLNQTQTQKTGKGFHPQLV